MKKTPKDYAEELAGYAECSGKRPTDLLRLAAVLWAINREDQDAIQAALAAGWGVKGE